MKKTILVALTTFAIFACSKGDNPTSPTSNTPDFGPHTQLSNSDNTPANTPEEVADPNVAPKAVHVTVNSDGNTHVFNGLDETYNGTTCVFIYGPQPQVLNNSYPTAVNAGMTKDFPIQYNGEGLCGDVKFQVDSGLINCDRRSDDLGDVKSYNFPVVNLGDCECVPRKPVTVSEDDPVWGEWGECPPEVILNSEETCYECRAGTQTITLTDGCKEWTIKSPVREKREVECPTCEPVWTPQEPTIEVTYEYGEWTECTLDNPEDTSETGFCLGHRSRRVFEITTTTTIYTNQCDERTRTDVDVQREQVDPETEPCRASCPIPEEGHCFYNNRGSDGKEECEALPGFVSWNEENHLCELIFNGVCRRDFHLNPGQSVEGCLKWTGGDQNCDGFPDN